MSRDWTKCDERFRALIENAADLVALTSAEGICEFQSPSSEAILGYRPDELVGCNLFDFVHPDDLALTLERLGDLQKGRVGQTLCAELRFRHKNGSWRVLEVKGRRLADDQGRVSYVLNSHDVTERNQTEATLRFIQLSVDRAGDLVHWMDLDGRILFVNEAMCRRTGYSREELLSMTVFDLAPGLTRGKWRRDYEKMKNGDALLRESTHCSKGGEIYPVEVSTSHVQRDGREYIFAYARDTSERKQVEEALRTSQSQLEAAMDLAGLVNWEFDTRRGVFTFNDRFYALYGTTAAREGGYQMPAEVYAKTFLHPDDQHVVGDEVKKSVENTDPDYRANLEHRIVRRDGEVRHIVVRYGVTLDQNGRTIKTHGANQDITERKRAEEALRTSQSQLEAAMDLAGLVNWEFDVGTRTFTFNDRFYALYGTTAAREGGYQMSAEEYTRRFVHPDDRHLMGEEEEKTRDPRNPSNLEHRIVRRDGEVRHITVRYGVTLDQNGQVIKTHGSNQDITERKQTERALVEARDQLRQTQKVEAIGQLAGGIAHDFNNLLTAIIGYSDMVLAPGQVIDESHRPELEEIRKAAERASALTRQILAYSRRQALRPTVVSLNDVVSSTERLLRRTLGEDVDLATSLCPDLGLAEVDVSQFEQVLVNLALNARDAMSEGGGRLTIKTANVELGANHARGHPGSKPGPHVMVAVSDTGVGMDEETVARAFEPFFTTKEPGRGTGLGLSTVYGIVSQSGGDILLESEPGQGTTVKIFLPSVKKASRRKRHSADARSLPPSGREAILVVEDEEAVRTLVSRVLSDLGYDVSIAADGDEALALLAARDKPVDLLLSDVLLPGRLRGDQLAKEAKAAYPDLAVLFMSGYTRDAMIQGGHLDTSIDYLQKPFAPSRLGQCVREILDRAAVRG